MRSLGALTSDLFILHIWTDSENTLWRAWQATGTGLQIEMPKSQEILGGQGRCSLHSVGWNVSVYCGLSLSASKGSEQNETSFLSICSVKAAREISCLVEGEEVPGKKLVNTQSLVNWLELQWPRTGWTVAGQSPVTIHFSLFSAPSWDTVSALTYMWLTDQTPLNCIH